MAQKAMIDIVTKLMVNMSTKYNILYNLDQTKQGTIIVRVKFKGAVPYYINYEFSEKEVYFTPYLVLESHYEETLKKYFIKFFEKYLTNFGTSSKMK
jgi:hypothetical protein